MKLSRSPWSDGRGRGGRTRHWLAVGVLRNCRGVRLYDPRGDVGAGYTPSIRGRRKETLDRSLVAHLNLGGSLTGGRHPALDPSRANPSNSMRMYGLMCSSAPPTGLDDNDLTPEGEAEERHEVSLICCLVHSGTLATACCSDLMDQHESMR
jgi:hypothetical protein